jgi:chromosome segregation protein
MKLKSITMHGFKSFADRVTVQYHDGITGVIGPNGSGKSNIIDAVRWVMGEQTAKSLRADDPTDIIFAGSQSRKPLSMAEVTLTFTNTGSRCPPEFLHLPEVSIGRRIYRSGEREYFLNKEPCRLKDIVDFLLAIGLGSKSYAIIQQDKRDRIIQASPDDLREILEETAGISIFKTRRKEAEKRLESTGEKLRNLGEIETEITKQVENLSEQVVKAQRKLELQAELREKEITVLSNRIGFFRSKAKKLRDEIEAKNKETQTQTMEAAQWETEANELKAEQLDVTTQIKDLENAFDEKRLALTKFRERLSHIANRKAERVQFKANFSQEITFERENLLREENRHTEMLSSLESADDELRRLDGESETLQMQLEECDETLQVERIRGEELRSEIRALEEGTKLLRSRNETALAAIEKANQTLSRAEEQLREFAHQRGLLAADRRSVELQLNQLSGGLESVAGERAVLDAELNIINDSFENAKAQRDAAKERLLEVSTRASGLQKMVGGTDGLSDGAKLLREKLSGFVHGFVFEKVTVQREDEEALERSLADLLEAALVPSGDVLVDLLDKVEESGGSRVGILLTEVLSPLTPAESDAKNKILAHAGIRCVGDRLTRCELPVLKTLFDRIFIARDEWLLFKAYRQIPSELRGQFMFITERGTLVSGTREIAFGESADGVGHGLLQRKRELQELESEREAAQSALANLEGGLFEKDDRRKKLLARVTEIDAQLSREKVEVLRLTSQLETLDLQLRHLDENVSRVEGGRSETQSEIDESRGQYARNQSEIDRLENERAQYLRDLQDFDADLTDKKERRDEVFNEINRRRTQRATVVERQANFRRNYEEAKYHLQRLRDKVDRGIAQLSEIDAQITQAGEELSGSEREIQQLEADTGTLENELNEAQGSEAELSERLRVLESRLKNQRDHESARQKFVAERQVELGRFEMVLETSLKDAKERFNLEGTDFPPEAEDNPQQNSEMEKRMRQINNELAELGAVNERAVDEYREAEGRRLLLVQQKADIEHSVQELYSAIAEIEETTKTRFAAMYEQVNTEFVKIFPVLFPGGNAKLQLLKPEDMLTTGVEIMVQLPGKRMQNMSLFSGGEKALTAISLIFSLLKTTPAPFCYLDEVDAPLDEANVGRFNSVLEALSGEFQFVVITHNRRTMEILDTIYGISMAEPGVSRLVAVDLSDVPEHLRKKKQALRSGATAAPAAATLAPAEAGT